MFIPSIPQIRNLDSFTINNEPIDSIDLMERAAQECSNWITLKFNKSYSFTVICGSGNNGGDGFAIARHLLKCGYLVNVYFYHPQQICSKDCETNLKRLISDFPDSLFKIQEHLPFDFRFNDIIIDALFGSGLNKTPDWIFLKIIQEVNRSNKIVISIDMPSGLFADKLTDNTLSIVKSTYTLSFEFPKLAFLFSENEAFIGQWILLSIGLMSEYFKTDIPINHFLRTEDMRNILLNRPTFSHKGSFGNALLIAGKYSMAGAAILSGKACLKSGVGLLHIHVPRKMVDIIQVSLPEAITEIDSNTDIFSELSINTIDKFNAIAVGPGIGTDSITASALKTLIQNYSNSIIFDADAINILSENKTWLEFIPKNSIFTPHPKEFDRLTQVHENSFSRLDSLRNFSIKHQCICILKGAHTAISMPNGEIHFNSTGNSGLATGGSGDVLTGILLGLLAQSYTPKNASFLAVFIHGLAADLAVNDTESQESLIPTDVIRYFGKAFNTIRNQ